MVRKEGSFFQKRGQVTIIVIVAIVIVAVVFVFFISPRTNLFVQDVNPSVFLRNCIEPEVGDIKEILSRQGGYLEPNNYVLYQDEKIQYLCYTSEIYKPCIVQQPLLVKHIESEIKNFVEPKARQCVQDLKEQYERRGFDVSATPGSINVSIVTGKIIIDFLSPMVVSKDESAQTFQKFAISIDSGWYDLLLTAVNIIQYESILGDSETTLYIQYYPDLKIEKIKRTDEGTIYILSDVITEEQFVFASKSLNWPAGFEKA